MKSRMIVSSKTLGQALTVAIPIDPDDEHPIRFHMADVGIHVAGQFVTSVHRDWDDFDIDRDKAKKLHRLLLAMSEQPITVTYDGNWFTIQEVLV